MCKNQDNSWLSLPDDVTSCYDMLRSMSQTLAARESRVQELEAVVDRLLRERFGPKRERYDDPDQLRLFEGSDRSDDSSPASEKAPVDEAARKKHRGGTGRRRLDEDCRREQRIHRLREDQKCCAKCSAPLVIVLVQGSEQWSYRPSEIFGLVHLHEKGFCNAATITSWWPTSLLR